MGDCRRIASFVLAGAMACMAGERADGGMPVAPPAPGRGYGQPIRTIDGLQDVRAALPLADGSIVAALGSGGVVRVELGDGEEALALPRCVPLVAPWPEGGVAEAVALAPL
ncbi:MAG: hypothetical protein ACKOHI_08540, partial [Phycisphaerales bacterium]